MPLDDPNLIIAIIVGAIVVFGAGFTAGTRWEKKETKMKELNERIDRIENGFFSGITDDPELSDWMRNNSAFLMKLFSKFKGGNNS
ncbi:hypothetical protein [Nitrosopumilus sp.]|uniref:hypothetical protein n=1 Tax=Nitrosopumilus sp. TaxID=2024843 RepID=UPI0026074AB0|nr:hypothetical protein [Nitrosopumilus sp.]